MLKSADALVSEALVHDRAGRLDLALDLAARAIATDPGHVDGLTLLGRIAGRVGNHDRAIWFFQTAADAAPAAAEARYNLGLAFLKVGDRSRAGAEFAAAIGCRRAFPEAHVAIGNIEHQRGDLIAAAASFERAISYNPGYAGAFLNLANVRREQYRLTAALSAIERAVAIAPDDPLAQRTYGIILREWGRLDEAVAALDRAVALAPDFAEARSERLFSLNYHSGWNADEISWEHRLWGRSQATVSRPLIDDPEPGRRIRIGLVSGDLHQHPVGFFLTPLLENHDPDQLAIICYSNGSGVDPINARLRAAADRWHDLAGRTDEVVLRLIREDKIDILVDLSGHAARNRLGVFVQRAAPIQMAWLGYVASTGLSAIDYVIMDGETVPPISDRLFTETVVRISGSRFCYAPPVHAPLPGEHPPSAVGGPVTFASFSYPAKLGPSVLSLWAEILHSVPRSRLVLKWMTFADAGLCDRIREAFVTHGIAPDRLELRGYSPHAEMLGEYAEVDVALDPFPHGGGLTTCEALWMGVPVITLPGDAPASRQSLAFLTELGLLDLVADSRRDYVDIAVRLASDGARLTALRRDLRARMAASGLCDGPIFARKFERLMRDIWDKACQSREFAAHTLSPSPT